MADTALQQLTRELGRAPAGLESLSEAELRRLADTLHDSRRRQEEQVRRAMEGTLHHVPALLRGAVRRVLFP